MYCQCSPTCPTLRGHTTIVQLLLATDRINVEATDANGSICSFHISAPSAKKKRRPAFFLWTGSTALMLACRRNHVRIANLLLAVGANRHMQDRSGSTAIDLSSGPCAALLSGAQLVEAARCIEWGGILEVRAQLAKGDDVNSRGLLGRTYCRAP